MTHSMKSFGLAARAVRALAVAGTIAIPSVGFAEINSPFGGARVNTPVGGFNIGTPGTNGGNSPIGGYAPDIVPSGGFNISTPVGSAGVNTPLGGFGINTPVGSIPLGGGFNISTPVGSAGVNTPLGGFNISTPIGSINGNASGIFNPTYGLISGFNLANAQGQAMPMQQRQAMAMQQRQAMEMQQRQAMAMHQAMARQQRTSPSQPSAINCAFGNETLLAKSVNICENAGGKVNPSQVSFTVQCNVGGNMVMTPTKAACSRVNGQVAQ